MIITLSAFFSVHSPMANCWTTVKPQEEKGSELCPFLSHLRNASDLPCLSGRPGFTHFACHGRWYICKKKWVRVPRPHIDAQICHKHCMSTVHKSPPPTSKMSHSGVESYFLCLSSGAFYCIHGMRREGLVEQYFQVCLWRKTTGYSDQVSVFLPPSQASSDTAAHTHTHTHQQFLHWPKTSESGTFPLEAIPSIFSQQTGFRDTYLAVISCAGISKQSDTKA